ncbi:MAG: CDGSH iron-sulfur domain-containing protein [Acidimicrobiales bacterium]
MGKIDGMKITVTTNGPYEVEGSIPLSKRVIVANDAGDSVDWADGEEFESHFFYKLCRCGQSKNKPFCDDSHMTNGFDGTETASRQPYAELARTIRGPRLTLSDAGSLCAEARFCDPGVGIRKLIKTDSDAAAHEAVGRVQNCPSGRLVVRDTKTDVTLEPDLAPSIGIIDDPAAGVAGPIWVRGGIPIVTEDGDAYEIRNRVTLCRCGASSNKPFCDSSHVRIKFQA